MLEVEIKTSIDFVAAKNKRNKTSKMNQQMKRVV